MYSLKSMHRCTSLLLLLKLTLYKILFSNSVSASGYDNFAITCLPKPPQLLTFIVALDETFLVNRTQSSVEVATTAKTIGQVTGGVFGGDTYKFDKFIFYWNTPSLDCCENYSGGGNYLASRVIFYNTKYKNIDEASSYPDGVVDVLVPVAANAPIDNPTFSSFEKLFKENIINPGDQIEVNSGSTFTWFAHFGPSSVYKTFKGTYYDSATTYPCTTIVELPSDLFTNFISCKQYSNTFGSLKDSSGNTLNNPLPEILPLTPPTSQCGVTITNIKFL